MPPHPCLRASLRGLMLLLAGLACPWRAAHAQQAIVTMPSADVTGPRQLFFMHESQVRVWGDRPYWAGTYFLTYGLGYGTELAATVFDQVLLLTQTTNQNHHRLGTHRHRPFPGSLTLMSYRTRR